MVEAKPSRCMISGPTNLTTGEFVKYYVPRLHLLIYNDGVRDFCMGGASGADEHAQTYLAARIERDGLTVHVYDKGAQRNVKRVGVRHSNGFTTYQARDAAMTKMSQLYLCFARVRGGVGSGTFQNVVRSVLGAAVAERVTSVVRAHPNSMTLTVDEACELLDDDDDAVLGRYVVQRVRELARSTCILGDVA